METHITFNIVQQKKYNKEITCIMNKLRKGTSIHKNANPEELQWSFDWGKKGKAFSPFKLLSMSIKQLKENKEENIRNKYNKLQYVCSLKGKIGRWYGVSESIKTPIEVIYHDKQMSLKNK